MHCSGKKKILEYYHYQLQKWQKKIDKTVGVKGKEGQTRGDHREKEKDMCPMWKDFMRM